MSVGWSSSSNAPLNVVDSVHCITGRSNANMSWIFLEILPGISWKYVKFVDTLVCLLYTRCLSVLCYWPSVLLLLDASTLLQLGILGIPFGVRPVKIVFPLFLSRGYLETNIDQTDENLVKGC